MSLQTDWNELTQEIKGKYTDIVGASRLKNKTQQPVRVVKLEFISVASRHEVTIRRWRNFSNAHEVQCNPILFSS